MAANQIYKIVLTGGPCAGKTSSIMRIKNFLEDRGFLVLTIPEAASVCASIGINLCDQINITLLQKNNEDNVFEYAKKLSKRENKKVVVLLDRGLIDGMVYIGKENFENLLKELDIPSIDKLFDRYDNVLYLVSAAKGAENFYDRNIVRTETVSHAREVESKTLESWKDFPKIRVFGNQDKSFENKLREVVGQICEILDIPHTEKAPQKFLLLNEQIKVPEDIPVTTKVVVKIFVKLLKCKGKDTPEDEESYSFIRSSECNGITSFVIKTVLFEKNQRIERKENLTSRQFEAFKNFADPQRTVVKQTRQLFSIDDTHFEVCHYHKPSPKMCLLSVYNSTRDHSAPKLPEFLLPVREVTKDHRHSAHYLSLIDKNTKYYIKSNSPEKVLFEKNALKHLVIE